MQVHATPNPSDAGSSANAPCLVHRASSDSAVGRATAVELLGIGQPGVQHPQRSLPAVCTGSQEHHPMPPSTSTSAHVEHFAPSRTKGKTHVPFAPSPLLVSRLPLARERQVIFAGCDRVSMVLGFVLVGGGAVTRDVVAAVVDEAMLVARDTGVGAGVGDGRGEAGGLTAAVAGVLGSAVVVVVLQRQVAGHLSSTPSQPDLATNARHWKVGTSVAVVQSIVVVVVVLVLGTGIVLQVPQDLGQHLLASAFHSSWVMRPVQYFFAFVHPNNQVHERQLGWSSHPAASRRCRARGAGACPPTPALAPCLWLAPSLSWMHR